MLTAQRLALDAFRQIDPRRMPYITEESWHAGANRWTYHPVRRHLVLRTTNPEETVRALACALLAKNAYLGPRSVTAVPEHLKQRHQAICEQIENVIWALQR